MRRPDRVDKQVMAHDRAAYAALSRFLPWRWGRPGPVARQGEKGDAGTLTTRLVGRGFLWATPLVATEAEELLSERTPIAMPVP